MAGGNVTDGNRAPSQGGVIEGMNPSKYNPKDPITMFIIQVCLANAEPPLACMPLLNYRTGRPHHYRLPHPPLASLQDPPTPRYR